MADDIKTPAEFYAQTANLPAGVYVAAEMGEAVLAAIRRLDVDKPNVATGAISGADANNYDISAASMSGWDEDASVVHNISYPFTVTDENVLADSDWYEADDPVNGRTLVFTEDSPATGEAIRVRYTAPYTEGTVPTRWISSVAKLAAANYLRMLAARATQAGESTINADVFSSTTSAGEFRRLATDYENQYEEGIGIGDGSGGADASYDPSIHIAQVDVGGQMGAGPVIDYEGTK